MCRVKVKIFNCTKYILYIQIFIVLILILYTNIDIKNKVYKIVMEDGTNVKLAHKLKKLLLLL